LINHQPGDAGGRVMRVDGVAIARFVDRGVQRQNVKAHQAIDFDPHGNAIAGGCRRCGQPKRDERRGEPGGNKVRRCTHQPIA
jgi:hypothetical protein